MRKMMFQRMGVTMRAAWVAAAGLISLSCFDASASDYHVVSENTVTVGLPLGELLLTDTVVQDGPSAINRFTMHRLRRPLLSRRGNLLLLPSLGNSFRGYLFSEDGDVAKSFAAFFARLGYEVWAYSPRTSRIAAGQCGGALDCSPALSWSLQTIVNDATFIRSRIAVISPGKTIAGGLSLGAVSALALVNQHPTAYAGVLAWEGSIFTANPAILAHNQAFCDQFAGLVAAGVAVEDQSLPFVKAVAGLAKAAPNAPFAIPVPGFPPGLTNHQALVLILATPNPIAPSPRPGFITAAGDFVSDTLFYSDDDRLIGSIALFDDVTSNRASRDLYCSLAGIETAYTANLANFTAPTMIIKAGQGFGPIMDELPGKLGSTSVTFLANNNFAHVDHLGSPAHLFLLELPIAQWLNQVLH